MTTITKTITRAFGRKFIVAHVELRENDTRGLSDGFSVTGELYEAHGTWSGAACYRAGRDADASGMIHDEILKVIPSLAPVVTVHVAAPDGTPMHAVSNGWYFYSGAAREYELRSYGTEYANRHGSDHDRAAEALHVSPDELPAGMGKAAFIAYTETLPPVWAAQAAAARAVIDSL